MFNNPFDAEYRGIPTYSSTVTTNEDGGIDLLRKCYNQKGLPLNFTFY